ncbi:hypothetical protein SDC9_130880 [bioreactor metagenome]|uniref:Uncharacterized protein n=1 Tax=bioreactor metagenome TaxID=1076179 RepID=A0A645D3R2_9ZZZZ
MDIHTGPAGPSGSEQLIHLSLYVGRGGGRKGIVFGNDRAALLPVEELPDHLYVTLCSASPDEIALTGRNGGAGKTLCVAVDAVGVCHVKHVGSCIHEGQVLDGIRIERTIAEIGAGSAEQRAIWGRVFVVLQKPQQAAMLFCSLGGNGLVIDGNRKFSRWAHLVQCKRKTHHHQDDEEQHHQGARIGATRLLVLASFHLLQYRAC